MANENEPKAEDAIPELSTTVEASELLTALWPVIAPGKEDEARGLINSIVQIERRFESRYAGPLPPASEMAEHEKVLPGAADRILSMAETEQQSRHAAQNKIIDAESRLKLRGQPYALTALLILCALALVFLLRGYASQGATITVSLVVLVTAMFLGPEILKLVARRNMKDDGDAKD